MPYSQVQSFKQLSCCMLTYESLLFGVQRQPLKLLGKDSLAWGELLRELKKPLLVTVIK